MKAKRYDKLCDGYGNYGYRDIMPAVKKNREKEKSLPVYDPTLLTR